MKLEEVDALERILMQLMGMHEEISHLSSKHPDDAINKFKLKFINQLIFEANKVLTEENLPLAGFSKFDEDDLPTNSDVVFIISSYLNSLEQLRSNNILMDYDKWYWEVDGKKYLKQTYPPKIK
jgi:hypothetical protein